MMINSLYQLSNKGSLRTLSFILALFLTAAFFLNLSQFSTALRTAHPAWILTIFWGLINLWIHGIGFDIRRAIWQLVFLAIYWLFHHNNCHCSALVFIRTIDKYYYLELAHLMNRF